MISFDEGPYRFNYRIVGIAMHGDRVLLHRAPEELFWTFPGGRAELGEPAEATLRREMREELRAEIEVVRLLWLVENFFPYDGRRYHEIALYFLMRFPPSHPHLARTGPFHDAEGERLIFQWFPLQTDALTALPLLPSFLPAALQELPDSVRHVVHWDA